MTTNTLSLITEYIFSGGHTDGIDSIALHDEAVLVNAAPDLLAALEHLLPIASRAFGVLTADLDAARAAIAKAKGA